MVLVPLYEVTSATIALLGVLQDKLTSIAGKTMQSIEANRAPTDQADISTVFWMPQGRGRYLRRPKRLEKKGMASAMTKPNAAQKMTQPLFVLRSVSED